MYYQYFGLTEAPFSIAVNPRYLFMSPRHRDALAHLLYGVGAGGGFILLTGEVGTGKTTINRCLLEQLPEDTDTAIILNPALNAVELLATACDELDIDYDRGNHTLKTLTDHLHRYLLDNHAGGRKTVLLIDEAQHLDFDVLEQIRLLTNLETNSEKLLQIILIGQPELAQMLARPELRQLNQRITARYNLEPLNLEETGAYIHHRLQVAGMSPERVIFPPAVVRGIHRHTRGIPRVINVLCDRMLLGAYGRNKTRADRPMLNLAVREVLGDAEQGGGEAAWQWPVAIVGGLLAALVVAALFYYDRPPASPVFTSPPVAVTPASPPVTVPAAPAAQPAAEVLPAAIAAEPATVAPMTPGHGVLDAALLLPGESMARLWSLYSDATPPANPCPAAVRDGLLCATGEASTWDEVSAYDRPLSLELVTEDRFSAEVLLLGIDGRSARVWTPSGMQTLELSALAPLWTGAYAFLWHPPAGFGGPLAVGDTGSVVSEVARLFALLDGQQQALAGSQFNDRLQQRVRLFQRRHGLVADGVVGVQTLLKLNEQLGIDLTAAQAQRKLAAGVGEGAG